MTKQISLKEIKNLIKANKPILEKKFYVKDIGIFGSYVRGEADEESDVDILVEFGKRVGFFKFLELEEYLRDLLKLKVDLVTKKALKPRIGQNILRELVLI